MYNNTFSPLFGFKALLIAPKTGLLTLLLLTLSFTATLAQTPGLIVKRASTAAGRLVLDPNSDGYVSKETTTTPVGFTTSDEGAAFSEIPYRAIPLPPNEVMGDLLRGPTGGFSDFSFVGTNINPAYTYTTNETLDANKKLMFRIRLGGIAPNSKGYSILIDTDNKFGNTGTTADPNYSALNPGFEAEIVLATNFFVYLYNVDGISSSTTLNPIVSLPYEEYSQKAVAYTTQNGNADYFYDFYIPFSQIPTSLFSPSTTLRMVANTVMSPHSALKGPISDVGGVDDTGFSENYSNAWNYIITNQIATTSTTTTTTTLPAFRSDVPVISTPITTATTLISGTSSEPAGSVITVYLNGVALCGGTTQPACTTVASGSGSARNWYFSLPSGVTLSVNDQITATAQTAGESMSAASSIVYVSTQFCTLFAPTPTITCSSDKGFKGTVPAGSLANGAVTIKLYQVGSTNAIATALVYDGGTNGLVWGFACNNTGSMTAYTSAADIGSPSNSCSSGQGCVAANTGSGSYYVVAEQTGRCASPRSEPVCLKTNSTSPSPVFNTGTINAGLATISGTISAASMTIILFVNNQRRAEIVGAASPNTGTTSTYAWSFSNISVAAGDILSAWSYSTATGVCVGKTVTNITVQGIASTAPVVTGPIYAGATSISGTSVEAAGTAITVYKGGVAMCGSTGQPNCPTVNEYGTWTLSGIATSTLVTTNTITATATSVGETVSPVSNTVTVTTAPVAPAVPVITGTYYEQGTSVTGTGPANTTINVYIDKALIGTVTSNSSGVWTLTGLSAARYDLYAGGKLTATSVSSAGAESAHSTSNTVQCNPGVPSTTVAVSAPVTTICANNTVIVQVASQANVIYTLRNNGNTANMSTSVLGTGSTISLTSFALTTSQTLRVNAKLAESDVCPAVLLSNSVAITVNPNPASTNAVAASPSSVCSGSFSQISVAASESGYSYQLRNNATNAAVGSAVAGTGSTIYLNTGTLTASTTFNVFVTNTVTGCSTQLAQTVTVTVGSGSAPAANNSAATASPVVTCGNSATITINSTTGLNYRLLNITTNTYPTAAYTSGNNGQISLSTGAVTSAATFVVEISNGSCTSQSNQIALTTVAPSNALSATPATICSGSSSVVSIASSQAGYTYTLRNNATNAVVAGPINGVAGSEISFAAIFPTTTTTYNVLATSTGCTTTLPSTVTITVNSLPSATNSVTASSVAICYGGSSVISVAGSQSGFSYQLRDQNGNNVGLAVAGTGDTISFAQVTPITATTYNVLVYSTTTTSCSTQLSQTVTIKIDCDADGIDDSVDEDDNNDGITDLIANKGNNAFGDADLDGVPNFKDPQYYHTFFGAFVDKNNDGINDWFDLDRDGIINQYDIDIDGDGITNVLEANNGVAPSGYSAATGKFTGTVGANGIPDVSELREGGGTLLAMADHDADTLLDFMDQDSDNDGIPDMQEAQPGLLAAIILPSGFDADKDGLDDAYDASCAPCTSSGITINPINSGGTTSPDYFDLDSDGDGSEDFVEGFDNNNTGVAIDDLLARASAFASAGGNASYYNNSLDSNNDGVPNWLARDGNTLPNYLRVGSAYYFDTDKDGLVDLLDTNSFGVSANAPDNNTPGTPDYRNSGYNTPLPVELLSFTGKLQNSEAVLNWITTTEVDNEYFQVERSSDGVRFAPIGNVAGNGNSTSLSKYSFTDSRPVKGIGYYRLKQVDSDGGYTYSNVIALQFGEVGEQVLTIAPNPATDAITLNLEGFVAGEYNFQIFDLYGHALTSTKLHIAPYSATSRIDISGFPGGKYFVLIAGQNTRVTQAFIKQ